MVDSVIRKGPTVFPKATNFSAPTLEDKQNLINDLRKNFNDQRYDQLFAHVKDNLQTLATHRNWVSKIIAKNFQIELPDSMQEAVVILALKKHPEFKNNVANLTSEAIREVVKQLVLKEVTAGGRRVYDTSNRPEDSYKHQIIHAIEYSQYRVKLHFTAGIKRLNASPIPENISVIPEKNESALNGSTQLSLIHNEKSNLHSERTDKLKIGMHQKIYLKKIVVGLIHQKIKTQGQDLTDEDYRDILADLHNDVSPGLKRSLDKAGLSAVSKYSLYSNSRAKTKINTLQEELKNVPSTPSLLPYSNDHYTFLSTNTHVISGLVALSDIASEYSHDESVKSVYSAMGGFFKYNDEGILTVNVQGDLVILDRSKAGDLAEPDVINVKKEIAKIFPPDNADKQAVIEFYNQNPILKFSIDLQQGNSIPIQQYELKPVLVHDKENNRHYLHFELSKVNASNQGSPQLNSVMLNFCGNGISQNRQIRTAAKLLEQTGVKQIIPMYANKGINLLLNPDLSAATTSIKGSVNPHIMAYNSLVEQNSVKEVELQIYAHSYGNLSSAKFMERVRETTPDKRIFYIGSATASSLLEIAKAFVGDVLASAADTLKLLNNSDVFSALNYKQTTAIIFNDSGDKLIRADAQIQNHPLFNTVENKEIVFTDIESERETKRRESRTRRIEITRDKNLETKLVAKIEASANYHYNFIEYFSGFESVYKEKISEHRQKGREGGYK